MKRCTPPADRQLRFSQAPRTRGLYVDKTSFVAQVLDGDAEVLLSPRPRRFGKTVNPSTLRCYVEKSTEDVQSNDASVAWTARFAP